MISCSNAILSGRIATSAPSLEIFLGLEGLRKLPGFVIALVHPTAAFSHRSEMGIPYQGMRRYLSGRIRSVSKQHPLDLKQTE
jgi:hypothetical protein